VTAWEQAVDRGEDPLGGHERLTAANRVAETVYLGLRTVDGLPLEDADRERAARWQQAGWVDLVPSVDGLSMRLRCTPDGWLRLDALAADLTAVRSRL
jgi:oxygen-independent coproporphyrinogen-3 oxidase